jgi:hypothetical protein
MVALERTLVNTRSREVLDACAGWKERRQAHALVRERTHTTHVGSPFRELRTTSPLDLVRAAARRERDGPAPSRPRVFNQRRDLLARGASFGLELLRRDVSVLGCLDHALDDGPDVRGHGKLGTLGVLRRQVLGEERNVLAPLEL